VKCQGFTKSQGSVRKKIVSGISDLKLFIVSCIFAVFKIVSSLDFVHFILVLDHALLHACHTTDNDTSTGMM